MNLSECLSVQNQKLNQNFYTGNEKEKWKKDALNRKKESLIGRMYFYCKFYDCLGQSRSSSV